MDLIQGNIQNEIYIMRLITRTSVLSLVELTINLINKLCGLRKKRTCLQIFKPREEVFRVAK